MSLGFRLILLALAAATLFGAYWRFVEGQREIGWNERDQVARQDYELSKAIAKRKEKLNAKRVETAVTNARVREKDAWRLRTELAADLERLRQQLAEPVRVPGSSEGACDSATAPYRAVLGACAAEYSEMAGNAQGHSSDVRTLLEAWPE